MTARYRGAAAPADLVAGARAGDPRAVARLITMVEQGAGPAAEVAAALTSGAAGALDRDPAHVIGLTGAPGVGKSTTASALVRAFRAAGRRVGVLAVDPSSPFTGGAILGDRIRMADHTTDPGVYLRSMSSRGHLGGLAAATGQATRVLEAAGCDVVLVETVGVGQAEVEIASLADTTLVLLAPGMGDGVQAVKAGVLEIADIYVVNKADRDGAQRALRDLRGMLALGERAPGSWSPPVLRAVASRGEGIDEIMAALAAHRGWLGAPGPGGAAPDAFTARRRRRAAAELTALVLGEVTGELAGLREGTALPELAARVAAGTLDPYTAVARLRAQLRARPSGRDDQRSPFGPPAARA